MCYTGAGAAGANSPLMCQHTILSQKGQTVISQCPECRTLSIWQHNLLLNFSAQQFRSFKHFTAGLDAADALFPFPGGEERLVLRTPNSDICLTFSTEEWEDFQAAMEEAEYMSSVYDLIR